MHSLGAAVPHGILQDPRREPRRNTDTASRPPPGRDCSVDGSFVNLLKAKKLWNGSARAVHPRNPELIRETSRFSFSYSIASDAPLGRADRDPSVSREGHKNLRP